MRSLEVRGSQVRKSGPRAPRFGRMWAACHLQWGRRLAMRSLEVHGSQVRKSGPGAPRFGRMWAACHVRWGQLLAMRSLEVQDSRSENRDLGTEFWEDVGRLTAAVGPTARSALVEFMVPGPNPDLAPRFGDLGRPPTCGGAHFSLCVVKVHAPVPKIRTWGTQIGAAVGRLPPGVGSLARYVVGVQGSVRKYGPGAPHIWEDVGAATCGGATTDRYGSLEVDVFILRKEREGWGNHLCRMVEGFRK